MAKPKHKFEVYGNDKNVYKTHSNKNFSVHNLVSFKPMTDAQRAYFEAYYQDIPVIVQTGSAGTGKTACALYTALSSVFDKSTAYERINIVRSAVQARNIGFLPGTMEEKDAAYEQPYISLCNELLTFKDNTYRNLKAKNLIQFYNTSFLRGSTWDNTIVIVDECQSMTYHELCTIFTRLGTNSRIIFCGDQKQNDLTGKHDTSGLTQFMKVLSNMPRRSVEFIHYRPQDIVRSGIVKEFLIAEEETV